MKRWMPCVLALLAACSGQNMGSNGRSAAMEGKLDAIRVMIKQSALMAANAACGGKQRGALVHAAAVMNRRAMGGPEMAAIHKMMGMQPGESGMPMKQGQVMDANMQRHVALHDAGEAVFDLLEAVGEGKATCANVEAVRLAADAAMLREAKGPEPARTARDLQARLARLAGRPGLPAPVKEVVRTLGNI